MSIFGFDPENVMKEVEKNRKTAGLQVGEEQEEKDVNQQTDEGFFESWKRESRFSVASGNDLPYVVIQVTLKEKMFGTGSVNLTDLEEVINSQVEKGYRLHTMATSTSDSKGIAGGDRIQATLVFERLDIYQTGLLSNNKEN